MFLSFMKVPNDVLIYAFGAWLTGSFNILAQIGKKLEILDKCIPQPPGLQ